MITRRTLIRGTAGTLAGTLASTMVTRPVRGATVVERFQELPTAGDERLKVLISTAVDAAVDAGAKYTDARLSFTQAMTIDAGAEDPLKRGGLPFRFETMDFGVRAQFDGYWGFASSPVWTKEEAARLGRGAVANAKANVLGKPRDLEMAPNSGATSGDWIMPVTDDPFAMDVEEIYDYLSGVQYYIGKLPISRMKSLGSVKGKAAKGDFFRQQKAFGSSDGQYVTQRVYRTVGVFGFTVYGFADEGRANAAGSLDQVGGSSTGLEYIRHAQIREWIRQLYEELAEELRLPVVPVDVGRYLTLIPPTGVAQLLHKSVGVATEIDRVMGYEANGSGTSYIIDPNEALGALKIGTSSMHVTASRSSPGGLAHVKWDDEGVEPKDFTLVENGILTSLQSNREGAAWMKHYSDKTGQPFRSHGCAHSQNASFPQLVYPSDLRLQPDMTGDTTLKQLREQMENGIEFKGADPFMDFQQSTGMMTAPAFKIEKGKRVARIVNPGMLFRTSELWGNMQSLGGPGSVLRVGLMSGKGEPIQAGYSSVDAPPALFKEMSVINSNQKA